MIEHERIVGMHALAVAGRMARELYAQAAP